MLYKRTTTFDLTCLVGLKWLWPCQWNLQQSYMIKIYQFRKNFIPCDLNLVNHYDDVIMGTMASQIASLTVVYSTFYSGAHQSKHPSSASLAFVRGIHRGPVNSPHKWPVMRKMFPFDDVIMYVINNCWCASSRHLHQWCLVMLILYV